MAKFSKDGYKDECEYPSEELSVVDAVFDHAPTQKLEAIVAGLREQIKNLQHEKANLAQEIRDTEEAGRANLARYKKYDQLKTLDMFLDGKITHYVVEKAWSGIEIIPFEDKAPGERWDKDKTKLLTLFGKSDGNLEWKLSEYSDGSGTKYAVIPCVSYDEALILAQGFVNSKMDSAPELRIIDIAKKYGLKIDPEYIRKCEEKERTRKDKEIKDLEGKLKKLRENV